MTLRTLTFDPAQYKLVPITPEHHMCVDATDVMLTDWWAGKDTNGRDAMQIRECSAHDIYQAMLAAVPDTLPGVVEHDGEPAAWMDPDQSFVRDAIIFNRDEDCHPEYRVPLFTHAAPAADLMVDMGPPATSRDRWMYEQGRLAERDPRTHASTPSAPAQPAVIEHSGDSEMRSAFEAKYGPMPERMSQKRAFAWLDWKMAWEAAISAQPVERQELSDAAQSEVVGYMNGGDIGKAVATVYSTKEFLTWPLARKENIEPYVALTRAIIAADRGQA